MFGVIPSFALIGPLALLAMLFPGAFAAVSYVWKQWRVFGMAACSVSTLSLVHWLVQGWLPNEPWTSVFGLQLVLNLVVLASLIWAKLRYRPSQKDPMPMLGRGIIVVVFLMMMMMTAVAIKNMATWGMLNQPLAGPLFTSAWIAVGLMIGLIHTFYHRLTKSRERMVSSEFVALLTMLAMGLIVWLSLWPTNQKRPESPWLPQDRYQIESELIWESTDWTEVLSPMEQADGSIYFGVGKQSAFHHKGGIVCINSEGEERWQFDADETMRPVFAMPTVWKKQLFIGEGLHEDEQCRLIQLDATTGGNAHTLITTQSHIEGSPTIDNDGTVFIAAGADGVYAVRSNKVLWHVDAGWHCDTPLTLHDGNVFGGSGYDRKELFALDAGTGNIVWRKSIELRSFGKPLLVGENVVFGLGTGNLGKDQVAGDATTSKGALLCLNRVTGQEVWRHDLPGAVHAPLLLAYNTIFTTARNGMVFAIDPMNGDISWKNSLQRLVTAGPVLLQTDDGETFITIVDQQGEVIGLSPRSGLWLWRDNLAQGSETFVEVFATPSTVLHQPDLLLIGGRLRNRYNGAASAVVFKVRVDRR